MISAAIGVGLVAFGWPFYDPFNERIAIEGTVGFRGELLAKGIIRFLPQEPGLEPGGAIIRKGRYAIAASKGLTPGIYSIVITSPRPSVRRSEDAEAPEKVIELIPSDYNRQTTLFCSVQRGQKIYDFDLSPPPALE